MASFRHVQLGHFSPEEVARRAQRRAARQGRIYGEVSTAVVASTEGPGTFQDRHAYVWNAREQQGSSRKISGSRHPGLDAASYVAETFGAFAVHGSLAVRFAGMDRQAGYGAHGITDGAITVEVMVKPLLGMAQILEVPVTVKRGYLLQPGIFYHQGSPYILSQSALDDVMEGATFQEMPRASRKHMYCPPDTRLTPPGRTMQGQYMSQRDYEQGVADYDAQHMDLQQLEEQRKQRRLQQQHPFQSNPDFGMGRQDMEFEGGEESQDLGGEEPEPREELSDWDRYELGDDGLEALEQQREKTGEDGEEESTPLAQSRAPAQVHRETVEIDQNSNAKPSSFGQDYARMTKDRMQPGATEELKYLLHQRRQRHLNRPRRAEFARLACDISLPLEEVTLLEGSLVTVLAERQEGLHVQHESGQELMVQPSWLEPVE